MSFDIPLRNYHTLAVEASCSKLLTICSEQDVYSALVQHEGPFRILGGGSNVLPSKNIAEVILLNTIKGINVIDEDDQTALVAVGAGEYWHQFVMWTLSHNLGGLENLSYIPGKVGAAPMQNIGAYGVEQDHCFHSLKAIDLQEGTSKVFYKDECSFGYRDSIFKNQVKGRYIITQVNYLLSKKHELQISYGAIMDVLSNRDIVSPTIQDVSDAVIDIRKSKLPDPKVIPNAGSFFKNPIISLEAFNKLQKLFPDVKYYEVDQSNMKIPAAWLIEQAGLKGVHRNGAGTHKNHALVVVNYDNATGQQILDLASEIESTVLAKFDIKLEKEVNIW